MMRWSWIRVAIGWAILFVNGDVGVAQDLPVRSGPGSLDRQIQAVGTRAGVWGTLRFGLEAWVYPLKAFDGLEIGLVNPAGHFQSIHHQVRKQSHSPVASLLEFEGADWTLRVTLFVPRETAGGRVSWEGTLPEATSLALRFRPVLGPMHLPMAGSPKLEWQDGSESLWMKHPDRSSGLMIRAPSLDAVEWQAGGRVRLRFRKGAEARSSFDFMVTREPIAEAAIRMDRHLAASRRYYRDLLQRLPEVDTPDAEVNQALLWAGISLDQLRIRNPDLGWGLVSGYSSSRGGMRPKHAHDFKAPTLASRAYHRLGLSGHVREALESLKPYHRADGKTVREVAPSWVHWPGFFEESRPAYQHTDGPVYCLVAYGHYLRSTGEESLIRNHWPAILGTYRWCLEQLDPSDGLLRIDRGASESSTEILKDTQLELMWVRALREVSYLARFMEEESLAVEAEGIRKRAMAAIGSEFWDQEQGFYIWGINRAGEKLSSLVPHHAIGFWLGELPRDRIETALRTLSRAEFMTDWGIRSLALGDPRFDHRSYHSGSVWPVWNAGVLISDFQRGRTERAFANWRRMIEARWKSSLGPMPEVFRGDRFELLPEAVPHQMSSELAVVNGFYEGLLGLDVDVPRDQLALAPRLPMAWDSVRVRRVPFGPRSLDLTIEKRPGFFRLALRRERAIPLTITLEVELPLGGGVRSVRDRYGAPYYRVRRRAVSQAVQFERRIDDEQYEVVIRHGGDFEFRPQWEPLEEGSQSKNLRLIDYHVKGVWWHGLMEGRPGRTYRLRFSGSGVGEARTVEGGRLIEAGLNHSVVETRGPEDQPRDRAGYVEWPLRVKLATRPDRTQLLGTLSKSALARPSAGLVAWQENVERIRNRIQEVMGPVPGEERWVDLGVEVESEVEAGSYVRRLIHYQSEPDSRTPAYLLIPKKCLAGDSPAPGVLCLHPTDHRVGHQVVVGLGGKSGRNYAEELARRGWVAIAPSYPLLANYQPDLEALGYQSGSMKAIWDNRRAIDLLQSLPYVQKGGVAAIGHSLGGHNAIYTAVFDERIKVLATSCAFDSYLDYQNGDIRGWTSQRYMPALLDYELAEIPFDFHELLGVLAPRGLWVSAPLGDHNFKWESVDRIARAARPVYEWFGTPDHLQIRHPECGHDFPPSMREEAYRFLARGLGVDPAD